MFVKFQTQVGTVFGQILGEFFVATAYFDQNQIVFLFLKLFALRANQKLFLIDLNHWQLADQELFKSFVCGFEELWL